MSALDELQKKIKNEKKTNGKYWSSYVRWRNLVLLTGENPFKYHNNLMRYFDIILLLNGSHFVRWTQTLRLHMTHSIYKQIIIST